MTSVWPPSPIPSAICLASLRIRTLPRPDMRVQPARVRRFARARPPLRRHPLGVHEEAVAHSRRRNDA